MMYAYVKVITMDVPITQFRRKLFALVNQALEGKEVWVSHKGRRLCLMPEAAPSKLSRISPMEIIAAGANLEVDSWKTDMLRGWEQKWERKLGQHPKPARTASNSGRTVARKTRRSA